MKSFFEIITFVLSTLYVLFLNHISSSPRSLQKALVIILVTLLFIIYRFSRNSWSNLTVGINKLFFIFWLTIFLQLLIVSTGGLQSPFLILIHFFIIGLSFIFSFFLALLFLLSCAIIFIVDIYLNQNLLTTIIHNPNQILLQLISLIVIIPIAYIISRQYHLKDVLMNALNTKIKATDAILESLPELIIVTDQNFNILSTNDAVTKTLQRSRSELLNKPLFDVLLLKDKNNKLVTAKTFFPDNQIDKPKGIDENFTLIQSSILQRIVNIQIQSIKNTTENLTQISFIISFGNTKNTSSLIFDKARAKYDALSENIKQKLSQRNLDDLKTDMLLLEKIENDTYMLHELPNLLKSKTTARIDIAKLCKNIVLLNNDFAKQLHVDTKFELPDFGEKDIAPLTVKNYQVNPEQLTGPFFTVSCDSKKLELVIKKLFDMSILLAAKQKNPQVILNIKRIENLEFAINISGACPLLTDEQLKDLFIPYYGNLSQITNLRIGSGLEGYLAKTISENMSTQLKINYSNNITPTISLSLMIKKNSSY